MLHILRIISGDILTGNKIHIEGIQELNAMDGYRITLVEDDSGDDIEEICDSCQAKIKG